jgi:deoxyribodipyrimidine photo-lyase
MEQQVSLVYFQHDLRLDDQLSLIEAKKRGLPIIGVYLFPSQTLSKTKWGFTQSGAYRLQFLWDSLIDLKKNLSQLNIPLYVFQDDHLHASIFSPMIVNHVYCAAEPGSEEILLRKKLLTVLGQPPITLVHDKPIVSPSHYPWLLTDLPKRFTDARLRIETLIQVLSPQSFLPFHQEQLPLLKDDWQLMEQQIPTAPLLLNGGESEAKKHLQQYFFINQHVLTYKETRNNMLAFQDSSKLSPALSLGLLSPRRIYAELKKVETTLKKNASTYWLWFELLWRDFFYYLHFQVGDLFFMESGMQGHPHPWQTQPAYYQSILEAKTGYPLVDANLIELYQTGWMSNRGRQNVASFISKILRLDWRFGAALFEHFLIDYDVSSNYGNWQYISGVGVDPREDRIFNVSLQAKKYDPRGDYLAHWLPSLNKIPVPLRFEPWKMNGLEMAMYGCEIGRDYPKPILMDRRVQLQD